MPRFLRSLFGRLLLLAVGLSLLTRNVTFEKPKSASASDTEEKTLSSAVVSSKILPAWKQFQENRSIALMHVGKGGGLSLRAMTSLKCRLPRNQVTIQSIQTCIVDSFGSSSTTNPKSNPLALQTIFYAHMRSIPADEMNAATSWLIALRNPIDRLISAYQYSHPANCQDATLLPNSTKGCINHFILNKQQPTQPKNEQQLTQVFVHCFPNADMETFALAAIQSNDDCSRLARAYVQGNGPIFPIPHLQYNYQHYASKVLDVYDADYKKEFFGIRTEHLSEDFQNLNEMLGGPKANSISQGESVKLTHGSESFQKETQISLTPVTYTMLCCVMQQELAIYRDWMYRLWNLDKETKYSNIHWLSLKCGAIKEGTEVVKSWSTLRETWELWSTTTCSFIHDG